MIEIRVVISEEPGRLLQVQRQPRGDNKVTTAEHELAQRYLEMMTVELEAYADGKSVKTVHRDAKIKVAAGSSPRPPLQSGEGEKSDAAERAATEGNAS